MKKLISCNVAILMVLAAFFVGCTTTKQSPLTITQRTIVQAKITMTTFVDFELQNQAQLAHVSPLIHQYAEYIRANGQKLLQDAWDAEETYRTTQNRSKLDSALATLQTVASHIADLNQQALNHGIIPPTTTPIQDTASH